MNEWRDALHARILTEEDRENNITLWLIWVAIRNAMDNVSKAFGQGSFTDHLELVDSQG